MYKQCPKCGASVPDHSNFCQSCGYDFNRPPQFEGNSYGAYNNNYGGNNPYSNNAFDACGPEGKCRGIAALFAIFLGGLGLHYFYTGKTVAGLLTILLTIVTCSAWSFITFIQGIYFFCITNDQFENRFVAGNATFPVF